MAHSDCCSHTALGAVSESTVTDPVCGMTVDSAKTPHRHTHEGHEYFFCSGGCRGKFIADPAKYLRKADGRTGRAAGHDLYLSDAPANPAGGPRLLPDLRHGARAGKRHSRSRSE